MRKLFRLAVLAGIVLGVSKIIAAKKEWSGLTEAEARSKLDTKLAGKVDDAAKRTEISDMVVAKMKERGMLRPASEEGNGGVTVAGTASGEPGSAES